MTKPTAILLTPLLLQAVALAWSPSPVLNNFQTSRSTHSFLPVPSSSAGTCITKLFSQNLSTVEKTEEKSSEASPARSAAPNNHYEKGVWVPPSQNVSQRKGKVFSIQQPQDLLDFVIEDERLSVVKVYASWCKTCKTFDVRYRKVASQYGDKYDNSGLQIVQPGRVRFAEMEYDNPNNEEMCKLLNATKLPYILMYKGSKGKVAEFQCNPSTVQKLYDAINDLADSDEVIATGNVATPITAEAAAVERKKVEELQVNEQKLNGRLNSNSPPVNGDAETMAKKLAEKEEIIKSLEQMVTSNKQQIQQLTDDFEKERIQFQGILNDKNEEIGHLMSETNQLQESRQTELARLSLEIDKLSRTIDKNNQTILSLELELSYQQKATKAAEEEKKRRMEEWERSKSEYEVERNSLRKLSGLAVLRVRKGARSLLSKLRRKKGE